ncbi:MAG: putative Ig domain-containing protein [Nitrospira sp.]|nr:putative Ig domain-containing protein [Nitrospira sp.]
MSEFQAISNVRWIILVFLALIFSLNGCNDVSTAPAPPPGPAALEIVSSSPLPSGSIGIRYSTTLAASGGNPSYSWSLASGSPSLPNGLSLNSNGVISGTPTTIQTVTPRFQVVDSSKPTQQVAQKALTISINAVPQPTITAPAVLPNGIVGQAYPLTQLTASGGTPPYTGWTVTPALPSGLVFNTTTGTISGTPLAPSNQSHTFTVTDSFSPTPQDGSRQYTLTITPAPLPLTITTNSPLPNGTVTVAYLPVQLAATGGTPPLSWSVVSGNLPPGLQLNQNTGTISGTPTTPGTFTPTIRVQDVGSPQQSTQKPFSITVVLPGPPSITTTSLPNGSFNSTYNQTLQVTGGVSPRTWGVISGSLPPGLGLNAATGNISGTATQTGTFSFTVQVTDAIPQSDSQPLSITITPPAPPQITTSSLPNGTVTQAYPATQLQASGGTAPLTWDPAVQPALPNGLSWNAGTHTITGTPLNGSQGTTQHVFTVRDSTNPVLTATRTLSLTVNLPAPPNITTTSNSLLPNGTVTKPYSRTLQASGGTGSLTWSIPSGSLPTGLNPINETTGVISGTPSAPGTFNFTARATDTLNQFDDQPLSIVINLPAPPNITTTVLPNGTVGSAYNQTVQASGGTGALTWSISAGSLPTGLNPINPTTGLISGTPSFAGSSNFTVRATDTLNQFDDQPLSITVDLPAPPNITTTSLEDGKVGQAYNNQQVQAVGGIGNLTWKISAGALPPGLDIEQATGVIFGTPTDSVGSPFSFTVEVTDTVPQSDTQALSITINP